MANSKSALKRVQVAERNRQRNVAVKSAIRSALKKVSALTEEKADSKEIQTALQNVYSLLDKAVIKGVFHKNTAARYKGQATKLVNKAAA